MPSRATAPRSLFPPSRLVSISSDDASIVENIQAVERPTKPPTTAKRRLAFGKTVASIEVRPSVKKVYRIIKKLTGAIGGNGSSGAIYGELTCGSMQKMVNLMMEHTEFGPQSRFIDIGSGIGKPNIHVAQDPGCELSYGIEMERSRWMLGMTNLRAILHEADTDETIGHKVYFQHGNIMNAKTLDPFTHVYAFSIGFPPKLWMYLSEMWNRSESMYLICYSAPRNIIDTYEFDVELVTQAPTSMHASGEGHMGYIYRRTGLLAGTRASDRCDPYFRGALDSVEGGLSRLTDVITNKMEDAFDGGRATRSRGIQHVVEHKQED